MSEGKFIITFGIVDIIEEFINNSAGARELHREFHHGVLIAFIQAGGAEYFRH